MAGALLRRLTLRNSLLGKNRLWRTVFLLMMARRAFRRVMGSEPEIVATERLKPGAAIQIASIDPLVERAARRRR